MVRAVQARAADCPTTMFVQLESPQWLCRLPQRSGCARHCRLWLEFGVHTGGTINHTADWRAEQVHGNVRLWKGLFSDTLPGFIQEIDAAAGGRVPNITYLHVDCDLYQGTRASQTPLKGIERPPCRLLLKALESARSTRRLCVAASDVSMSELLLGIGNGTSRFSA